MDSINITYNEEILEVVEIAKRNWVYVLYESTDGKDHYVEVVKGSIGVYTKVYKISEKGAKEIEKAETSEVEGLAEKYSE